ncbi:FAD-binding oxidoreductase [Candidatus Microgenomates bacterium]|nr:FAD-binding oxidoreductase [Candidatus Microgenomates bacterium]
MSKLVEHLRKHLDGEVLMDPSALNYFSTDGSIFKVTPKVIVYPKHATDVRKLARFSWQLAERGQHLPLTARGKGTDQAGAALGNGMILVMPAHMNRLLGFDKTDVVVQPGMLFGDLQRTLHSHGRFLPPYPSSLEFSTVGGAVANNAGGEKSLKYGSSRDYVKSLDVVLANGQLIQAAKISSKELDRKKGQADFEGEIYRQLDGLLLDNEEVINQVRPQVSKNAAGYCLWEIKGNDGSFDLSKLLVGCQGTLGITTAITFTTEPYNHQTHLLAIFFDDLDKMGEAIPRLQKLNPSAMEVVDRNLLDFLQRKQPRSLEGLIEGELPATLLLVEFDDAKPHTRKQKAKKANGLLKDLAIQAWLSTDPDEQERLWGIRHSVAAVLWQDKGSKKALPVTEDGIVPVAKLPQFLKRVYDIFKKHHLEIAVWGHGGDGHLHMQPFLDLSNTGDRQTVFKLMDEFYHLVINMGGATSGEHNDGRLRAVYLEDLYGHEMYQLFREVKRIFDPHNTLNPGVKIDVQKEDLVHILRKEYSMKHLHDHLPHLA